MKIFDYIPPLVNRIMEQTVINNRVHNPAERTPILTEMLIKVLLEFYLVQKKDNHLILNDHKRKCYVQRAKQWVSDCITLLIQPREDSCIACLDALLIESEATVGKSVMNSILQIERYPNVPRNWFDRDQSNEKGITNPYVNQIQSFLKESSSDDRSLEALIN
jgi:hypothetical protein